MKLKTAFVASTMLLVGASVSNAASFALSNLVDTVSDTLLADSAGVPMSGGVAALGYFPAGVIITSMADLQANLSSFTSLSSAAIGDTAASLGGLDVAGYALGPTSDIGNITTGNPLLGRTLYTLFGEGADLAASTAFGAIQVGTILDDVPFSQSYTGNPTGGTVVVGTSGSFTGDVGFGSSTYGTVNLVPEPSAMLLGALGALGLLRRRRN